MTSYRIAISAENHPYHGWQSLVGCWAMVDRAERPPLVLVHTPDDRPLGPEFRLIGLAGTGEVVACRDRTTDGARYAPRNIPGALLATAYEVRDDLVALIDPDVLMLRQVDFTALGVGPGVVSLDTISYLPHQANDLWVGEGCRRYEERAAGNAPGIAARAMAPPYGGNCYVVHRDDREALALAWLDAIEAFRQPAPVPDGTHYYWTTAIWAGMLAIHRLGLDVRTTSLMSENYIRNPASCARDLLHFCLGDETFAKRDYQHPPKAAHRVWDVRPAGDGTLSDLVREAVAGAGRFYGLDDPDRRRRVLVDGDVGSSGTRRAPRWIGEPGKGAVPVGDVVGDADGGPGDGEVDVVPPHAGLAVGVVRRGAGVDDHGLAGGDEVAVGEAGRHPQAAVEAAIQIGHVPAAVGGGGRPAVHDHVEDAAAGDADQLPLGGGRLVVQPTQHAEGRPGNGVGDEVRLDPGLAEQGGVVGLDEGAAGVDVQLRRDQERVVQRQGREAHVSRLVLPEPRLRRARGRRRTG